MAFCNQCGQQLAENSKFCENCGAPVRIAEPKRGAHRETVYEGKLHKCPNCGEVLKSFTATCPACGHEFRGARVSQSVHEFALKLEQAKTNEQKITLIRNFPIPNTKEDVIEFMMLASTNIYGEMPKPLYDAWRVKVEQSYQKAILLFQNDANFSKIQTLYDETTKKVKKDETIHKFKSAGNTVVKTGNLLTKALPIIIRNALVFLGLLAFMKAIQIDRVGDNGVGYELLGGMLLVASAALLMRKSVRYTDIAIGAGGGLLTFYLAKLLDNGSGLQIFGVVALFLIFISFIKKTTSRSEKGE